MTSCWRQVDARAAMEMRPDDTAFIWGDRSALMRDSTGAPRETKGPPSENNYREMLAWGRPFTDLIDAVEPTLSTLFGGRFRLDHYYLNLLKRGNRVTSRGLHGNQFGLGTYHVHDGQPRCGGLVTVAFELLPVPPGCGGFACIEGSHKASFEMPQDWRSLAAPQGSEATHPFARVRCRSLQRLLSCSFTQNLLQLRRPCRPRLEARSYSPRP